MKLDVVHNESGPLERSTKTDRGGKGKGVGVGGAGSAGWSGMEERVKNIQEHLNVEFGK